ncbi:MAG: DUF3467 domain-containing protein [Jatrophihabitans sp.]
MRFPVERAPGVYANGMTVGANAHELVVDFLISVDGPGIPPTVEVVQRVRLPIAMASDLLRNIAVTMDAYEQQFGPIHRPGDGASSSEPTDT